MAAEYTGEPLLLVNPKMSIAVRRGACTGAIRKRDGRFRATDGGTLLLEEGAELPLPARTKLLRVMQEGTAEPLGPPCGSRCASSWLGACRGNPDRAWRSAAGADARREEGEYSTYSTDEQRRSRVGSDRHATWSGYRDRLLATGFFENASGRYPEVSHRGYATCRSGLASNWDESPAMVVADDSQRPSRSHRVCHEG